MKQIKEWFKGVCADGILYIFGSGVFAQLCSVLSSVLVIQYLSKTDYGNYVNANNQYSYIAIFISIGLSNALLQYCSEKVSLERKGSICKFSFTTSLLANSILSGLVICLGCFNYKLENENIAFYIFSMALLPLLSGLYSYFLVIFRAKKDNKSYAFSNIVYSFSLLIGNVIFTRIFSVYGLIISHGIAYCASIFYSCRTLSKDNFFSVFKLKNTLTKVDKVEILKFAIVCALTNFVSTLLSLVDVTCLNIVLKAPDVLANYNVAALIPSACMFVPNCLMTFYYPQIVEKIVDNNILNRKYIFGLLVIFGGINLIITSILFIFAPFIINLVFSSKYLDAVPIFRVLCVNFFIAGTFNKVFGNVLFTIKKVNINFFHTAIAGILNVVLDVILINMLGSVGSAIATVVVTIFIALLEIQYLVYVHQKMKKGC